MQDSQYQLIRQYIIIPPKKLTNNIFIFSVSCPLRVRNYKLPTDRWTSEIKDTLPLNPLVCITITRQSWPLFSHSCLTHVCGLMFINPQSLPWTTASLYLRLHPPQNTPLILWSLRNNSWAQRCMWGESKLADHFSFGGAAPPITPRGEWGPRQRWKREESFLVPHVGLFTNCAARSLGNMQRCRHSSTQKGSFYQPSPPPVSSEEEWWSGWLLNKHL